jgi:hypothetical protein
VAHLHALPGHRLLKAQRVGPSLPGDTLQSALSALAELARANARIIDVHVSLFERDVARRREAAQQLASLGFAASTDQHVTYARTVALDLQRDEPEILAALPSGTRRKLRVSDRRPVTLRPIVDASLAPRLDALFVETLQRTGGAYDPPDWDALLTLCRPDSGLARCVGLFLGEGDSPEDLLAYATAFFHGDSAHYDVSASTRDTEIKVPLLYPVLWDLVRWSKQRGALWFDFGGITSGSHGSDDPLGGISDFKRNWSTEVIDVAEDWHLEAHPMRARLAGALRTGSAWVRRVAGGR